MFLPIACWLERCRPGVAEKDLGPGQRVDASVWLGFDVWRFWCKMQWWWLVAASFWFAATPLARTWMHVAFFSALADGWPVWRRNLRPSGWIATDDFEDSDEPGIYLFRLIFLKIRHCLFGHMLWSTFCREIHCNTGRMHDRYLQYSSLPAVWRLNISFS